MSLLAYVAAALALALFCGICRARRRALERRRTELRRRVAYMLWVMAGRLNGGSANRV